MTPLDTHSLLNITGPLSSGQRQMWFVSELAPGAQSEDEDFFLSLSPSPHLIRNLGGLKNLLHGCHSITLIFKASPLLSHVGSLFRRNINSLAAILSRITSRSVA